MYQAAQLAWPILGPDFSVAPERPGVGQTVQFTDLTVANGPVVESWTWDFGDGDTSTLQDPTHGFDAVGCYDVTLTVTSDVVMPRAITKGVPVSLAAPTAAFSHVPNEPDVGQSVQFTDLSTGDYDSRVWDFGDGDTSTAENPNHTYATNGEHDVTLTVTNGCDTDQTVVTIMVCETVPPVSYWTRSVTGTVEVGQGIFFYEQATPDEVTYLWNFDDGTTSTARNVYKSFAASGSYDVSLTVNSGCLEDYYMETVDVCELPTAAFSSSPETPDAGEVVHFTDESTGGVVAWDWDFGDGHSSTLQNPTHAYGTGGTFTVALTVSEALGCTGDTTGTVEVVVVDPDIFADDFESGNTSSWSNAVP